MRTVHTLASLASVGMLTSVVVDAQADPVLRKQVNQNGDMVMLGNTLGHDCTQDAVIAAPVVGSPDCNDVTNVNDSSPDIFWRSNDPEEGDIVANGSITAAQARSTAVLVLPPGAEVTYARIYWAGFLDSGGEPAVGDTDVRIQRPSADLDELITVDSEDERASLTVADTIDANLFWYQSTAEITDIVKQAGAGAYTISDVSSVELPAWDNLHPMASWTLVVFYELATDTARNLTLFDGLDLVDDPIYPSTAPLEIRITGFQVPEAAWDAKFGIVTYEGESRYDGDALKFNGFLLEDTVNPADNFFNGSRSYLGTPVSNEGDLPQLTGGADSMSGVDMDVVDVSSYVEPHDRNATLEAWSSYDLYLLGVFVTSISTFEPNLVTSTKTVEDVNGTPTLAGDVLEYTITVKNTGDDNAVETVVVDKLPDDLAFIPGSIEVDGRTQTDADGDDLAEYITSSRSIIARPGDDADADLGGTVDVGENATVTFRVTVKDGVLGEVLNQGEITAKGEQGTGAKDYKTDGNGSDKGIPPTSIMVTEPGDTDGDGLTDPYEDDIGTDKYDADSDDDGLIDGQEIDPTGDADGDTFINALDPDSDDDGLPDGLEMGKDCSNRATDKSKGLCVSDGDPETTTSPVLVDTDGGGVDDGVEDANQDGVWDKNDGETNPSAGNGLDDDTDNDGLPNVDEEAIGTDPEDADSDDDGLLDGQELQPDADSDDDGDINALDPDSDNDGLPDGLEMGKDCSHADTVIEDEDNPTCVPDGDEGKTKTNPLKADTDGGGVDDADEDANRDGVWDKSEGETNPVSGAGGDDDTDRDGLPNVDEEAIETDPEDADSDDDGLLDGLEPEPGEDADDDGLINALDPDSDDDGLPDGLEMGMDCSHDDTVIEDEDDPTCVPDADPRTKTDPLNEDTDDGGVADGVEDANRNGKWDRDETNPAFGAGRDDDTDGDGLPDATEKSIGTDYQDRDSDDDGVIDGDEIPKGAKPDLDSDKDGKIDALDPDSDDDGLFDGTEMGRDCEDEGTDKSKKHCTPDADEGKTTTDPKDWDTDDGTVSDGDEDVNKNGRIDDGERNPRDPSDDVPRPPPSEAGAGGEAPIEYPERSLEGGGCECSLGQHGPRGPWGVALLLGGLLVGRRRRRA